MGCKFYRYRERCVAQPRGKKGAAGQRFTRRRLQRFSVLSSGTQRFSFSRQSGDNSFGFSSSSSGHRRRRSHTSHSSETMPLLELFVSGEGEGLLLPGCTDTLRSFQPFINAGQRRSATGMSRCIPAKSACKKCVACYYNLVS